MSSISPGQRAGGAPPPSGGGAQECIDLIGQVLTRVSERMLVETPFTADLAGAIEPISRALRTVGETVTRSATAQLRISSDVSRAALDEAFRSAGAREMLEAAMAVAAVPEGGHALTARSIQLASGAMRIPWLEIIKEILCELLNILPISGLLKKILQLLLKILDKIFGGMPHEDCGK